MTEVTREQLRVGVVEDHELLIDGLRHALSPDPSVVLVAVGSTVPRMLEGAGPLDLVVLDLSLPDGSGPIENLATLRAAGVPNVLVLTAGDRPDLIREAARAGAVSVLRKSEPPGVIRGAVRAAAQGQPLATIDWAAALDSDPKRPALAPREEEALALYAAGECAEDVAALMGISVNTVNLYLRRIRAKYLEAGTPVHSRALLRTAAQRDGYAPRPWWRPRRR
ncbi:response regulator [Nocardia caishijiensis]|uniref:DNA-binding NarL/FixJ family response regulator n=1 Tax=Nocardia caishijiensis TaxID=184756 RepID=A0ABQ6YHN2_9NOCA|nr:response regulator [Nocardia caishijiensis]KAF0845297.1 DNA-binding NarL/FixJ family response regulator [Nocardia caishijiensis]